MNCKRAHGFPNRYVSRTTPNLLRILPFEPSLYKKTRETTQLWKRTGMKAKLGVRALMFSDSSEICVIVKELNTFCIATGWLEGSFLHMPLFTISHNCT